MPIQFLFDKAEDMEMEKDTGLTSVKIEWIYLKKGKIKRYYFERLKGLWKLEAIDFADMPREDTGKEDFFEFYDVLPMILFSSCLVCTNR